MREPRAHDQHVGSAAYLLRLISKREDSMTSISRENAGGTRLGAASLGLGFFLAFAGSANAQPAITPVCVSSGNYLLTVTNPPTSDRQLIMDLIHRYLWALDEGTFVGMDDMLTETVTYQLCNGALQQLQKKINREELKDYLRQINTAADAGSGNEPGEEADEEADLNGDGGFRTRHFESNTLLHAVDGDTVQGKTALLVTLQFAALTMPVLDYTATLESTFQKVDGVWKFSTLKLITDGAEVELSAR